MSLFLVSKKVGYLNATTLEMSIFKSATHALVHVESQHLLRRVLTEAASILGHLGSRSPEVARGCWPQGSMTFRKLPEVSILMCRAGSRQVRFPDTLLHDGPSPGREVQFYAFLLHDVTSCGYGWRWGSGGTTHLEPRTTPVFDRTGLFLLKHGSSRNKNSPRVAYKELLKEKTTNGVTQYPPSSALSKLKWHLSLQSLSSLDTFKRYFHQNVQYTESRRWLLTGISPHGLR